MSAGGRFQFTRVQQGLFTTRGLSRNSESSRLLTHQNALRFRLRSSSHAWPSSLTPLPQKSSRIFPRMVAFKYSPYWPNRGMRSFRTISFGSARLTRAVSRISANWHKPDIAQISGGLQRQPNVRFSRKSGHRIETAIGTHRTLLRNACLYRSADGSGMLIHTLWI